MSEVDEILIALSVVFAIISAGISIKNWKIWKESDLDTIKAKVFLDKSFLDTNFKLSLAMVWIMGGLVSLHSIMEYREIKENASNGFNHFYYGLLPAAMFGLMLVTSAWFKLLNKHSKKPS